MAAMLPPNDRGWSAINSGIALMVLVTVAIALRFFTRLHKKTGLEIDDWTALAGWISICAMFIELILWVTIGAQGHHIDEIKAVNPDIVQTFFKIFLANEFTYSITSSLVKISIILFYRRIFVTKEFKLITNIVIGAVVAWGIAHLLGAAFECIPLAKVWDQDLPGTCTNELQYVLGVQGANIFLDFAILVMPIKPVWKLQRPWQDKVALTGIFLVGIFVCFASIYRLVQLVQIDPQDMPYSISPGGVWTFVEPCIGLVCGCLPIIRGLFPAFHVKWVPAYSNSKRKTHVFSFVPKQNHHLPGTTADNETEEYLRMPSTEGQRDFPMDDSKNIRIRTDIDVVEGHVDQGV